VRARGLGGLRRRVDKLAARGPTSRQQIADDDRAVSEFLDAQLRAKMDRAPEPMPLPPAVWARWRARHPSPSVAELARIDEKLRRMLESANAKIAACRPDEPEEQAAAGEGGRPE
jgi:hypothetical protein